MRQKLLFVAALSVLGACAPQLGDGCTTDTECSATGDRFCDRSQPGGYCTKINCEPKSCGSEGVCVRFKPEQPRLSSSWCMKTCSSTGDCDRDRYVCRKAEELGTVIEGAGTSDESVLTRAEVLDSDTNQKFCVVKE
jgi:hypothetical protein